MRTGYIKNVAVLRWLLSEPSLDVTTVQSVVGLGDDERIELTEPAFLLYPASSGAGSRLRRVSR